MTDPFPGHTRFVGCIAIPYLGHEGETLTMRFRCIESHEHRDYGHGKYMSLPDDPPRVYGVADIHEAGGTLDMAEGEFDRLILKKIGLHAIAIPGAHVWRGHMRPMLAGFNRVRVWADPDDAGADLANRVTRALRSASVVRLRDGDVTETYMQGGAAALLRLISEEGV